METTDPPRQRALESLTAASKRTGLSRAVLQAWCSQRMITHWNFGEGAAAAHVDPNDVDRMVATWSPEAVQAIVDEMEDLRRQLAEAQGRLESMSPLAADNVIRSAGSDPTTLIPLKRFYVYVLRDTDAEVVYVGQSRNVFNRVGSHVTDVEKGPVVETVQLIPCDNEEQMCALEMSLIRAWQPKFNRVGVGYRPSEMLERRGQIAQRMIAEDLA